MEVKMFIKELLLGCVICIFLVSCNSQNGMKFNRDIIDCISNENSSLPSQFLNYNFFCKSSDNKILILGIYDLQRIYEDNYNQMSYKSFLTKTLNQNLLISKSVPKAFELNKEVLHDYNSNKFEDFINTVKNIMVILIH